MIAVFLFTAVIVRAIIPLGYMPGNALAGEFLVLCPQGISNELAASLHLGHSADSEDSLDVSGACPIGQALSHAAPPVADIDISVRAPISEWAIVSSPKTFLPLFERRYASRAPPLI